MRDRLHILGIRHHGPGSAASTLEALRALDPAMVLVEGPPEANAVLPFAAAAGMRPPLALLVHAADDPARASFYPFAEFSPEWQAILWALQRDRALRFIDLPAGCTLAEEEEAAVAADGSEEAEEETLPLDPLSYLAAAAGHSDGEAWWNAIVEQQVQAPDVFQAIAEAMTALRETLGELPGRSAKSLAREALREAHMRVEIAGALVEAEGPVAVVCGAWHVPALQIKGQVTADRKSLRGLKKVKTEVTWVPWTNTRLAAASGYGAGVISPGWYQHLWNAFQREARGRNAGELTAHWIARSASLLRGEGFDASTASVIEAVRLAAGLAALRGHAVAGLSEMQDASLAALCHGEPAPLKFIESRLVIGEAVGEIDASVPQMPLQADLAKQQKKVRLKPEALEQETAFDLRSAAGLAKSTLLHRLNLIGVPWGKLLEAAAGRGTFRERWTVAWDPEYSVKLAEALVWGTTIEQAAGNAAVARGEACGEPGDACRPGPGLPGQRSCPGRGALHCAPAGHRGQRERHRRADGRRVAPGECVALRHGAKGADRGADGPGAESRRGGLRRARPRLPGARRGGGAKHGPGSFGVRPGDFPAGGGAS